jgi:GNAT superfamily N-acetyltransferase
MSTYIIRPARSDDLETLLSLRKEAEDWLRDQGIAQWTTDYYDYARGVLTKSVQDGAAWVVESPDNDVIATVTLTNADPDFWDPEDDPETALYFGKMIVARSHSGIGLGEAIMNWASTKALEAGKQWLRLDCRRDNYRLHDYYRARGFEYIRTVLPPRRRTESGALFQRPAGATAQVRQSVELREELPALTARQ